MNITALCLIAVDFSEEERCVRSCFDILQNENKCH